MDLESRDRQKRLGPKRLINSFKYALSGVIYTVKQEQNMIIHILMATFVIAAGFFFEISHTEWLICLLFIGLVMAMELINTSIEAVVDLTCPRKDPLAKVAKDTAAAAVLVFAVAAAIAGFTIFIPKIIALF